MSRMFNFVKRTYNPIVGCLHNCYNGRCWARIQARRQKRQCRLCYNFHPHFHPERLGKHPRSGVVFVVSMGDMWGRWVPDRHIERILESAKPFWRKPDLIFFFETKNPMRYVDYVDLIPPNSILSTTLETNRNYHVSTAPPPKDRYEAMIDSRLERFAKHVSIEPIMKFDTQVFYNWIQMINPRMVSVGYDNYNAGLPEPSIADTKRLIDKLRRITVVEVKRDRRRLMNVLS